MWILNYILYFYPARNPQKIIIKTNRMKKTIFLTMTVLLLCSSLSYAGSGIWKTTATQKTSAYSDQKATSDPDSLINALLPLIEPDSIQAWVQHLQDYNTRFCLTPDHKEVALWLKSKLESFGYTDVVLDSFQVTLQWPFYSGVYYTTWQYNVIADLIGTVNPQIHYIAGGHYDSAISGDCFTSAPGADDNASGTAATLEIARVLKTNASEFPSTIRFVCFAAEELGLYGSSNYVDNAVNSGEIIPMMVNMDMIAHDTASTGSRVHLQAYRGSEWVSNLATNIALNNTSLQTITTINTESVGSDSDPFFLSNYPVIFLQEDYFSPQYHSINDLASYLNFNYAAKLTRVACGMLIKAASVPPFVKARIYNPGDGQSLIPHWKPVPDASLDHYKVYLGMHHGVYDTVFCTTDTILNLNNLINDSLYFIKVTAVNADSGEGPGDEISDRVTLVTMDHGVLIVDDSEGGYYNPSDSTVDACYAAMCSKFNFNEYDATVEGPPDLGALGAYSSVIWHINKPFSNSCLQESLPIIAQYLDMGGNILFTVMQTGKLFNGSNSYPLYLHPEDFLRQYAGIDSINYLSSAAFNEAIANRPDFANLHTDSSKTSAITNYHLLYADALYAHDPADILFTEGTGYDSTAIQSCMRGAPIGTLHQTSGYNLAVLSFPLFYMDSSSAQLFLEWLLEDIFGESPSGISEEPNASDEILVYPNPTTGLIHIQMNTSAQFPLRMDLLDLGGRCLRHFTDQNTVDLSELSNGIYFLHISGDKGSSIKKLIIVR
jgi:hypothetical protein